MIRLIDQLLNRITMYRIVLYTLIFLLGVSVVLSFMHILPYDPFALLFMTGFLVAVCWISNTVFAWAFKVPANVESVYISALILALIITPLSSYQELWFIGWAGVLAMASKYIVA
ncbi:MAG: oxidoreductase, partial [Chloroflexota bacterium]